jgi:hypothetical protein
MRCLKCHKDGIPLNTEFCPCHLQVYLPSLLWDTLPYNTFLYNNTYQAVILSWVQMIMTEKNHLIR